MFSEYNVITSVLGAPGSGKSAVAPRLRQALPAHVVLDWDALIEPAGYLAGRDIRESPTTWPAYRDLLRAVVDSITPTAPVVLLSGCTPAELVDWPIGAWLVLDCSDEERRHRLSSRFQPVDIDEALADAARYRQLGLRVLDSTGESVDSVAAELADVIIRR